MATRFRHCAELWSSTPICLVRMNCQAGALLAQGFTAEAIPHLEKAPADARLRWRCWKSAAHGKCREKGRWRRAIANRRRNICGRRWRCGPGDETISGNPPPLDIKMIK
jgi:hypothetical protein